MSMCHFAWQVLSMEKVFAEELSRAQEVIDKLYLELHEKTCMVAMASQASRLMPMSATHCGGGLCDFHELSSLVIQSGQVIRLLKTDGEIFLIELWCRTYG